MNEAQNLKGSCVCGQVEYTIIDKPLFTQACHCKNCKKSTGSSFVIHTMVFEHDFVVKGEVSSSDLPTGSGKGYRVFFCVNCGVYLYCKYKVSPGRIAVRTVTLENPITPQAHIFLKDKDPWIEVTNKEICFDIYYDRDKIWPKESLKRLKQKRKT
ncbi:MAG: hypothetical protein CMI95_05125 [Pelagibacteraceae bacterium]|nr:hypothetical protein [Pelagibacteraceae bacterium]PPR51622.1 MAG: hypothetical protein CFH20_00407 [Alphaproteobacteria bacterium MarineAlpha5_Bin10]|tara:strand:- start:1950 stop:2417 length:468 start_codon:yes stop_codon:yes gene_type:complete